MSIFEGKRVAKPSIRGTTTIDHRICHALEINFIGYVLLDYITESPGIIDPDRLYRKKGMTLTIAECFLKDLVACELLISNEKGYFVTQRWLQYFDVTKDFDNDSKEDPGFWQIFKKHGNRKQAEKMYIKARKVVDKETLHNAAKRYMKSKEGNDIYMHASSYLNPEFKHWEDKIVLKDEQKQSGVLSTSITKARPQNGA